MNKTILLAIIFVFALSSAAFAKVVKEYYPNKKLRLVEHYNKNNMLDGIYKYYWPNGQLREVGRYKDGLHVGEIKRYTQNGELI